MVNHMFKLRFAKQQESPRLNQRLCRSGAPPPCRTRGGRRSTSLAARGAAVRCRRARAAGSQYIIVQIKSPQTRTVKGTATFLMTRTKAVDSKGRQVHVIDEIHVGLTCFRVSER